MSRTFFLINQTFLLPAANFALTPGKFILGRSVSCDLLVPDSTLSRRHSEITVVGASITVSDLDSRYGTLIDGERIRSSPLTEGQQVQFGRVVFLLTLEDPPHRQFNLEDETHDPRYPKRRMTIEETEAVLSPAQGRVLLWLLEEFSEKQVAFKLRVSPHTVHNHIREVYRALEVHSRPALLALFLGN